MKFKDFQAPVLFSSTSKALNLGEKSSRTFKYFQGCVGTVTSLYPRKSNVASLHGERMSDTVIKVRQTLCPRRQL